ncbi:MAG TPA: pyridine nucleotide-disulfide oxidoreductase [Sedimenticola sp.]|nr:pyridine nucleotide-disulfide oxidoreductase [Sedimenticola sp.]
MHKRGILLFLIALLVGAFFWFDLGRFLSLEYLQSQREGLTAYFQANPLPMVLGYFLVYVAVTGLSLPGATILTLAGGAIFGLFWGTIIISFASTAGATLAFLLSRFLLRDWVQKRFGDRLRTVNAGIERDGPFYLFGLRLVPIFPFFVINLVLGLTSMRTWTYAWVSQVGMLAGTVVYVNAGTQLGRLESLSGILSPGLLASFTLLALFPLLARRLLDWLRGRRVYAGWEKPASFDRNIIVIGAGSGGLVTAYIAAAVKARVSLIEKHRMGGDCLNTGCVPSKALIRSSRFLADAKRVSELGLKSARVEFDFADVMERVQRVIKTVEPHDSVERYTGLGVDVIQGAARIVSPWKVEVDGRELTTRNIVIATGARPFVPPIPGIEEIDYLTSDNLWDLRELPERMLVLGGGPIGCELAQCFARFGSRVTMVEMAPRLLIRDDEDVAAMVAQRFAKEGIDIRVGYRATAFRREKDRKLLVCEAEGREAVIEFDQVLVAVGRVANVSGFGLEELGVRLTQRRTVETNEFLQTNFPNIFACGDVAGPFQFTHAAAHQAWYAAVNALFGGLRRFRVDYSALPYTTYTSPQVAKVGLNESEAKAQGVEYEVTRFDLSELDRAIADEVAEGFVKVLTVPGKDRILGATIVGEEAGELITEFVTAIRCRLGLNKILGTIHAYPTLSEANKYVAGEWKRAHAPERLLSWVERFHAWRRN